MTLAGMTCLIVGGGIGGLAAALCLRARGAAVRVLERAPDIAEVGAGLQISPNGAAVLRALGLESELARTAPRGRAVVLKDYRRPGEVLRLDLSGLPEDQPYYFVHRADLVELLHSALRAAGGEIELGQDVARVLPDDARPAAQRADGTREAADLVVGADGLRSRARRALNGAEAPFFTNQVAWRALVSGDPGAPCEVQLHMGPGRHLVSYPLRDGGLVNLVAVQERRAWAAEGWTHTDDPANLRAAFADFGGAARQLLERVEAVSLWGLFRHPVASCWGRGGVALVGDAAHPTLPFLAQGANLALEDAWVLADSLERAGDIAAGLVQYQLRRGPRAQRVIAAASGNAWKYHLRFPPLRWAAHTALRLGGAVAPGRMLAQFDWLYAHDVTA